MSGSRPLHRPSMDRTERPVLILGAVASWILVALLFGFATTKVVIYASILTGPCVLLLSYFAFGGDIPLKLRQKGYRRLMIVPVVFWISFLAWFVVDHFSHMIFDQ